MTNMNPISEELKTLNSDLSHSPSSPFTVPEGYFDGFPAAMLALVKIDLPAREETEQLSPLLATISQKSPFTVPSGYFEENLENLAFVYDEPATPVLNLIDKKMPYEVPAGYFAGVENQMAEKVNRPAAKVISLGTRWMRMAAAAMLIGVIGLAGYNYFQEKETNLTAYNADSLKQQTAVQNSPGAEVENELKTVSVSVLDAFINNVDAAATATATKKTSAAADLKKELKDIPVDALDLFLDQVPTGRDDLSAID
ncbi:MAG: hypothetical protein ACO1OO_17495 [Flavisolibacter sp.]